jgi:hypothetical protein
MTDSSSNNEKEVIADMAGELIHTKMEMAKKDTQMTHVLHIGTFHMEIIPDKNINIREMFNEILDKLTKKYGDKLLEVSTHSIGEKPDGRHYG